METYVQDQFIGHGFSIPDAFEQAGSETHLVYLLLALNHS